MRQKDPKQKNLRPYSSFGAILLIIAASFMYGALRDAPVLSHNRVYYFSVNAILAIAGIFIFLGKRNGLYVYFIYIATLTTWAFFNFGGDHLSFLGELIMPTLIGFYIAIEHKSLGLTK